MPRHLSHHESKNKYKATWGTPDWLITYLHATFKCRIAIDLASSETHNKRILAVRFYSRRNPCPPARKIAVTRTQVVYCNPPGPSQNVAKFWDIWQELMDRTPENKGAFLLFNLDHWRHLRTTQDREVELIRKRVTFHGAPNCHNHPSAIIWGNQSSPGEFGEIVTWQQSSLIGMT